MTSITCNVEAFLDAEVGVWVATSEDIPELATEAYTIEALSQKLRQLIPELMLFNNIISSDHSGSISFQLTSHQEEQVEVAS